MAKKKDQPQPPPWLKFVSTDLQRELKYELKRLGEHEEAQRKNPDRTFKQSGLGMEWSYADPAAFLPFARALMAALPACTKAKAEASRKSLAELLAILLRRSLPLAESDLTALVELIAAASPDERLALLPGALAALERYCVAQPLTTDLRQALATQRKHLAKAGREQPKAAAKLLAQIDKLCDDSPLVRLSPDEGWADDLRSWVEARPAAERKTWEALLSEAAAVVPEPPASGWDVSWEEMGITNVFFLNEDDWQRQLRMRLQRSPAEAWRKSMASYLQTLGPRVADRLRQSLHLVRKSKPGMLVRQSLNRELMRGLIWLCAEFEESELAPALQQAATFFYENNSPLATPTVAVLCRRPGKTGAAALTTLASRVKSESRRSLLKTALDLVAERLGIDPDELSDEGLPTFGFSEPGRLVQDFGDARAELRIVGSRDVEISWSKADGKPLKSVPARVKREQADEVEALKTTAAGVREALAGLAQRLEKMWLDEKTLPIAEWRERLIDHPVAGGLGQSLVWQIGAGKKMMAARWREGRLADVQGQPLKLPAAAKVSLWHPLGAEPREVLAWRERLLADGVMQPFKQAHREIYLLTDAERQTGTYSNRFAAHILKQAQFRVLAKSRGWKADLVGPWDGGDRHGAERKLARWKLRAEFWIDGAGDEFQTGYTYIATDQVRFYRLSDSETEPLPLADVPPLVFSEVLRDVDLFVGVASVGNDPTWADGVRDRPYADYWSRFSFGELGATAETRKAVLAGLVPKLKIASRCKLAERFLVVRGKLRTYKIHLGSGNILMEPNDQYLCIVPKGAINTAFESVFLPFEGDRTLSIILSKALLLAADDEIADPSIMSQIKCK